MGELKEEVVVELITLFEQVAIEGNDKEDLSPEEMVSFLRVTAAAMVVEAPTEPFMPMRLFQAANMLHKRLEEKI